MRTAEPVTMPPPSTRFNSPIETGMRVNSSARISDNLVGAVRGASAARALVVPGALPTTVSTNVSQLSQLGHRPYQLGELKEQFEQMYWVLSFGAFGINTSARAIVHRHRKLPNFSTCVL